jgi:hypothetical protein
VRHIRDAFAHSKKLIDFNHELIRKELKKIRFSQLRTQKAFAKTERDGTSQELYAALCVEICARLIRKTTNSLKAKSNRLQKKISKLKYPFVHTLLPYLSPPRIGSLEFPLARLGGLRIDDPKIAKPIGLLAELLAKDATDDDNAGK